jgi:probable phosphoglycerate mutase
VKVDFQRQLVLPDGATEVILVRHGSVDPPTHAGDLVAGRSDPPLNRRGQAQAEGVARRLASLGGAPLFASPLRRTTQTVARTGREATVLEALTEVYLGEWEGYGIATRGAAADPEFVAMMQAQRWDLIPGAEGADDFAERVDGALTQLAGAGPTTVAVTHAGVIAEMCRQVTGSEPFAFLSCGNGSVTRIARMPEGRWTLLSFNETSHLENDAIAPQTAQDGEDRERL